MLRDDALQVLLADEAEQIDSAVWEMTRIQDAGAIADQLLKDELPLKCRPGAHVFTIEPKHIECVEDRIPATAQKLVELRLSARIEARDFTIEDRLPSEPGQRRAQRREGFVYVSLPRDKLALATVDVRERAESVHLQFEDAGWMVKLFGRPDERCL